MGIGGENNIPEDEKMATVNTEDLALKLGKLGSQIESAYLFDTLRRANAKKNPDNRLFNETNDLNDVKAAEKLKDLGAQAIGFCKSIENSKGNEVKSTNS